VVEQAVEDGCGQHVIPGDQTVTASGSMASAAMSASALNSSEQSLPSISRYGHLTRLGPHWMIPCTSFPTACHWVKLSEPPPQYQNPYVVWPPVVYEL